MKVLTLDIETIPDEEWKGAAHDFPPLWRHLPVTISWLLADSNARSFELKSRQALDPSWEAQALRDLSHDCEFAERVVTFNGRGFDMPLLGLRAMALKVDWSWWPDRRHRYPAFNKELFHWDMMDQLTDYGAARGLPLDGVLSVLGMPGKIDCSGGDVQKLWAAKKYKKVRNYCGQDVYQTWMLYLAFMRSHFGAKIAKVESACVTWAKQQPELIALFK